MMTSREPQQPEQRDDALSTADAEEDDSNTLLLDMHPDEEVWMSQIGHLRQWCPATRRCCVAVSSRLPQRMLEEGLRLLFVFQNLQVLELSYPSEEEWVEQGSLAAVCELQTLHALRITGGMLNLRCLDLDILSRLSCLQELSLKPFSNQGLSDVHVEGLLHLTALRSLLFRGSTDELTNAGMQTLARVTSLTQLAVLPIGVCVTAEGLAALSALPKLRCLTVGLHNSRQIVALRETDWVPRLSLVTDDPEVELSTFFTTLTLCLHTALVSLRLGTLQAPDSIFLISIGTLTRLTELKVGVLLAPGAKPFTCEVAVLNKLHQLRTLSIECVAAIHLPLTTKVAAMMPTYWPLLESLSLSVMSKPELEPGALGLLHNLQQLKSLSLHAPLDHQREAAAAAVASAAARSAATAAAVAVPSVAEASNGSWWGSWWGAPGLPPAAGAEPSSSGSGWRAGLPNKRATGSAGACGSNSSASAKGAHRLLTSGKSCDGDVQKLAVASILMDSAELVPINIPNLPQGLKKLVLECAHITAQLSATSAPAKANSVSESTDATVPQEHSQLLLPGLLHLELTDCRLDDGPCCALLRSATQLTHLELNEVHGITDASVAALRYTTGLRHLVLQRGPAKASRARRVISDIPRVSNDALVKLGGLDTLQHLEWAVGHGASSQQLARALPVLRALSSLRYLSIFAVDTKGRDAVQWREELRSRLPLCHVSDTAPTLLYDLWDDLTVTV